MGVPGFVIVIVADMQCLWLKSEWEGGGRDWKGEKGKMSYFYESHLQTN